MGKTKRKDAHIESGRKPYGKMHQITIKVSKLFFRISEKTHCIPHHFSLLFLLVL